MKGADQCPRCASRRWVEIDASTQPQPAFYALTLRGCANCKAIWEPFEIGQVWDLSDKACSFREACGNCAFRPGSHEQRDTAHWKDMVAKLKTGGRFYCHKGVPINPANEDGFDYPADAEGRKIESRMRICRGWLNMVALHWRKEYGEPPITVAPAAPTNDVRQDALLGQGSDA